MENIELSKVNNKVLADFLFDFLQEQGIMYDFHNFSKNKFLNVYGSNRIENDPVSYMYTIDLKDNKLIKAEDDYVSFIEKFISKKQAQDLGADKLNKIALAWDKYLSENGDNLTQLSV